LEKEPRHDKGGWSTIRKKFTGFNVGQSRRNPARDRRKPTNSSQPTGCQFIRKEENGREGEGNSKKKRKKTEG